MSRRVELIFAARIDGRLVAAGAVVVVSDADHARSSSAPTAEPIIAAAPGRLPTGLARARVLDVIDAAEVA